jgi:hypothetical protein
VAIADQFIDGPVIRPADVQIVDVRRMGSDQEHLAVQVRSPDHGAGGGTLRAVWFGGGEHADALVAGRRVDLAVEPRLKRWRGTERVEGHVRDVRVVQ